MTPHDVVAWVAYPALAMAAVWAVCSTVAGWVDDHRSLPSPDSSPQSTIEKVGGERRTANEALPPTCPTGEVAGGY